MEQAVVASYPYALKPLDEPPPARTDDIVGYQASLLEWHCSEPVVADWCDRVEYQVSARLRMRAWREGYPRPLGHQLVTFDATAIYPRESALLICHHRARTTDGDPVTYHLAALLWLKRHLPRRIP